ncbi:MAG: outer membrane lipoprotein-sorting protein [Gemmatimonadetes bacterium]|uniref:Outer membrane lipoprotein-sorting protein n=1 Tax=Candidatus Kutchimonas denitrificans TaxID=3056748 RepID=A0AAE4ZA64_9BACT|nr:outer membrane lipoprotein-sorting protein [Gemmatimonadota bacterium]NIR75883.1 outer membrane lipoprotein-sorting protein [Candidatus Kutchimonas denitrificans]NIS00395.1 outer membrane lipoprotein-sorting protein [Gemmatimonadota bacterium]NIT66059.1 outer membrane lipoprotein-sorting protein [Gemmatimonadota bacterium]NIU54813.1 outer membrane lipoprotein-sorting protein [Gemmatimonadota bacterium]
MIRSALLGTLALALLAVPAQAQSLEEVLDNYYEAIGGEDAWLDVNSMRATGRTMLGPGVEAPFVRTQKRPEMLRLEFTVQGMTGIQAYDGETAWMLMPFLGSTEPEQMPAEEAKNFTQQADIEGVLINYEEKGHQVEYLGTEEVQGTEAHKLKVTLKDGDVDYYYLDSEYFIPIMVESTREIRGNMMEIETLLSDYKEVGGLMIPHSMEQRAKGAPQSQTFLIDEVQLDVEVADSIFKMPETETEEGQGG